MTIQWTQSPDKLGDRIGSYGELVKTKVGAEAVSFAQDAQSHMRLNRPWQDDTGNARRGLRVPVVKEPEQIILYFIHSVEYGVNLELNHGGRYAIIVPTIDRMVPELRRRLRGVAD